MNNSISFNGLLYAKNPRHITQPIMCCRHGDAKFVKLVNEASKKNSGDFFRNNAFTFYDKDGVLYIRIRTKEIPTFNFFEKFFFDISTPQKKALQKRKEGVYDEFVFHLSKFDYEYLKENYIYITNKQLKYFETFILQNVRSADRKLAESFFNSPI